ncbi:MAG: hypothetical protein NTY80_00540 [candidate division SR1 bacterium]|nr:hypothetical protein [candidate division SR1 bacterium]
MKLITETPKLLKFFEADDVKNTLGVQLRIWETSNHTELVVRMENQNKKAIKLWKEGITKLNSGDVSRKVLSFLHELGFANNPENWTSSGQRTSEIRNFDEYEDRDNCIYFVFYVHKRLLVEF